MIGTESSYPHLTGISGGDLSPTEVRITHLGLSKRLLPYKKNFHRLDSVTDNSGNAVTLHFDNDLVSRISSTKNRSIELLRDEGPCRYPPVA